MITDIKSSSKIKTLDRASGRGKLKPYWYDYFLFAEGAPDLYFVAQTELLAAMDEVQNEPRPFLDAQRAIGKILAQFSEKHNFHSQFNERFGALKPSQVLGMQLYTLMVEDAQRWVYMPTQHAGHAFPHATYLMPRNDAQYNQLIQNDLV